MSDRNRDSKESLSATPQPRTPTPGELGLISSDRHHVARQTVWAWKTFGALLTEVADSAGAGTGLGLDTPLRSTDSRGRQQTVRDIAIGIGAWRGARTVDKIAADARAGLVGDLDQDALTEELREKHRGATVEEILERVNVSIEQVTKFCHDLDAHVDADLDAQADQPAPAELAELPVRSLLGTLPVLTLLHAATYQLAVYSLDIAAAKGPMPAVPAGLEFAGVEALVDVTGAIAARQNLDAAIAARTPDGVVATRSTADGSWHSVRLPAFSHVEAPSVTATSRTFIEVTTGRVGNIPALMLRRELVLDDIQGLLHITPVLEGVPGLPGGAALRTATASVRAVAGIGSGLGGRLSRLTRRGQ